MMRKQRCSADIYCVLSNLTQRQRQTILFWLHAQWQSKSCVVAQTKQRQHQGRCFLSSEIFIYGGSLNDVHGHLSNFEVRLVCGCWVVHHRKSCFLCHWIFVSRVDLMIRRKLQSWQWQWQCNNRDYVCKWCTRASCQPNLIGCFECLDDTFHLIRSLLHTLSTKWYIGIKIKFSGVMVFYTGKSMKTFAQNCAHQEFENQRTHESSNFFVIVRGKPVNTQSLNPKEDKIFRAEKQAFPEVRAICQTIRIATWNGHSRCKVPTTCPLKFCADKAAKRRYA